MKAICQKCGKEIATWNDAYLFWITPTIPPEGLYLCGDCRGIPWEEQEALFLAWWERREAESARRSSRKKRGEAESARRSSRKKRGAAPSPAPASRKASRKAASGKKRKSRSAVPTSPSSEHGNHDDAAGPRPATKSPVTRRKQSQPKPPEPEPEPRPWWEDPEERHRRLSELAQMAFELSR